MELIAERLNCLTSMCYMQNFFVIYNSTRFNEMLKYRIIRGPIRPCCISLTNVVLAIVLAKHQRQNENAILRNLLNLMLLNMGLEILPPQAFSHCPRVIETTELLRPDQHWGGIHRICQEIRTLCMVYMVFCTDSNQTINCGEYHDDVIKWKHFPR